MPFAEWEDREKLLKSCFCKEGHVRIPLSTGCYDPVRRVVTLKDPCFADYHCNDLPNTGCLFDRTVPAYNRDAFQYTWNIQGVSTQVYLLTPPLTLDRVVQS